jgi:integrase
VCATATGKAIGASNLRRRVLAPAVALASERLTEAGGAPLPAGLTPHSLRRTFASVLYALGATPPVVMAEMGHTDPQIALAIYAKAMSRDEGQIEKLRALVRGTDWAPAGHPDHFRAPAEHSTYSTS